MQKITMFFWHCSGADVELLKKCPTESSKYVGIGATIFFTGLFAALSGAYALYTIFDSIISAVAFGLVWGLMIFNLDRYIVSSMRKEGKFAREFTLAIPRILLAVIISIVIAKPLELKVFDKEIQPELIVMEQETYARQEQQLRSRFEPSLDSLKSAVQDLKAEIILKGKTRDDLMRIAQEEADGTGGSRRRNLGPIYKVKKADADASERELTQLTAANNQRIRVLETSIAETDSSMVAQLKALEKTKINGMAARMEALSRITTNSDAVTWAHWFIILLFIAIETAPVFVKLISSKGPYDNLLKIAEHGFVAKEIEETAQTNAQTKERTTNLPTHEKNYVANSLDAELS
ncbi:MAG TPA: DUF4407 domain-containing protein [Chryseolinea sp.]|jgi:hypothetical protein|nr:DUF4407 domain-containing protein [Chryseolinea sp.]